MTHVLSNNTWPGIEDLMEGHTPLVFKASEINMKYNYAQVDISLSKSDPTQIEIGTQMVTLGNHKLLGQRFSVMTHQARKQGRRIRRFDGYVSLDFDRSRMRYSKMCRQLHTHSKYILTINRYLESLINDKNWSMLL